MNAPETGAFLSDLVRRLKSVHGVEVAVCPPFPYLTLAAQCLKGSTIRLGAQNMHWEEKGAFTGEVSGSMLRDAGCAYVIIGHSERRQIFHETDEMIRRKLLKALECGPAPIVCIGETLGEREAGKTEDIVLGQLKAVFQGLEKTLLGSVTLAYEPVWAIGTGKTATSEQAQEVHRLIRAWIRAEFSPETAEKLRILYGGSVKPENAGGLVSQKDIDGALVGGASLVTDSFCGIIESVHTLGRKDR